mmetsp:Transcript_15983/g.40251  ORF Transcript_15983/g.40251 Transcript_15983/m.40251 type:complete len:286 (-) Transcript_15983:378-1235(-)
MKTRPFCARTHSSATAGRVSPACCRGARTTRSRTAGTPHSPSARGCRPPSTTRSSDRPTATGSTAARASPTRTATSSSAAAHPSPLAVAGTGMERRGGGGGGGGGGHGDWEWQGSGRTSARPGIFAEALPVERSEAGLEYMHEVKEHSPEQDVRHEPLGEPLRPHLVWLGEEVDHGHRARAHAQHARGDEAGDKEEQEPRETLHPHDTRHAARDNRAGDATCGDRAGVLLDLLRREVLCALLFLHRRLGLRHHGHPCFRAERRSQQRMAPIDQDGAREQAVISSL